MLWLPFAALALDSIFPDPKGFPHPVRAIGRLADMLEKPLRKLPRPVLSGGVGLTAILLLTAWAAFMLCILPLGLGLFMSLYLAWSGLALGALLRDGSAALNSIREAEARPHSLLIFQARRDVQMLVSRDTSAMDHPDLRRALAESLAENFNDAFVAPFFWLCLGGPVALWTYKAASTLDSMWGYRNERWEKLGKAAARLDDLLAWIPARLSALFLRLAARLVPCLAARFALLAELFSEPYTWPGWPTVIRQARSSASPNAGWPMATAAWLCNGKNGGPTPYGDKVLDKPAMGPDNGQWTAARVSRLLALLRLAGPLAGLSMAGAGLGVALLW